MKHIIRNALVIDAASDLNGQHDLFISDGKIVGIDSGAAEDFASAEIQDATGLTLIPGIVDLCARLREPGTACAANIASETAAAAAGGITSLCVPPDTDPVIDSRSVVELIERRGQQAGSSKLYTIGALTKGLHGEQLAEMGLLHAAGCVGVGNAQRPIANTQVLRRAMEYAASLNLTVFINPADPWLSAAGCMHEGEVSTRLGLQGIPESSETIALARDLMLIEQAGVSAHFHHITTAAGVGMIANAQARGLSITADVTAHHLHLTEHDVAGYNVLCHTQPPLRTLRDRDALRAGVRDGIIKAICSNHKPLDLDDKLAPFAESEAGISSLETLLPLALKLVDNNVLDLPQAIAALTTQPAEILGLDVGHIAIGAPADLCLFAAESYDCEPAAFISAGKNSPFVDWAFNHQVTHTYVDGSQVYARS